MTSSIQSRLGTAPEEGCKAPVKVVANTPITLSGEQTINTTAVVAGDRVLVNGQVDLAENGIYDVSTTAWSYAKDWNKANDVIAGMLVPSSADIQLYQLKTFTGDYVAGTTEVEFQTGVIASKQYENQLGSQAVAKKFTLVGMTYIVAGNDLIVERNGQVLILDKHYTETSTNEVTIITTVLATDDFVFRSSTGVTLVSTTTASVSHVQSGTTHNLATYLQNRHSVNIKDFGAKCDWDGASGTDDLVALQSALDYAIPLALDIEIPGPSFLSGSPKINKVVDGEPTRATVHGDAIVDVNGNKSFTSIFSTSGGGFVTSTPGDMFDSDLVHTSGIDPIVQLILFDNLTFQSTNPSLACYVLSDKYLRTTFKNCSFVGIRCTLTTEYVQSIYFLGGQYRGNSGTFYKCGGAYDLQLNKFLGEGGGGQHGFDLTDAIGCRLDCTLEGQTGTAIKINGSQGTQINMYAEGNATHVDLTQGDHYGLRIGGFYSASSSTAAILWGHAVECSSIGCYHTKGLVDNYPLHSLASNSDVFIRDYSANQNVTTTPGYARAHKPYLAVGLASPSDNVIGATASFSSAVMTVNGAPTSGAFAVGQYINSAGVPEHTKIESLGTGTGGLGTYTLTIAVPSAISTQAVTVSNNLHIHGGKDTTLCLTDEGLGDAYGGAVRGRGISGSGAELSLGVLANGVFTERALFNFGGGFGVGSALATGATEGHFSIPSSAGAPTGVPNNVRAGTIAIQIDSTNNKLYAYIGGWKAVTLT